MQSNPTPRGATAELTHRLEGDSSNLGRHEHGWCRNPGNYEFAHHTGSLLPLIDGIQKSADNSDGIEHRSCPTGSGMLCLNRGNRNQAVEVHSTTVMKAAVLNDSDESSIASRRSHSFCEQLPLRAAASQEDVSLVNPIGGIRGLQSVPIPLSFDVWQIICSFLTPNDLLEVGLGCTSLCTIADNPNRWKHFCRYWAPSSAALYLWGLVWTLEREQRALEATRNSKSGALPPWGAVFSPEASARRRVPKDKRFRFIMEPCKCLRWPQAGGRGETTLSYTGSLSGSEVASDAMAGDYAVSGSLGRHPDDSCCLLLDDPLTLFGLTKSSRYQQRALVHWKRFWTAHLSSSSSGPELKHRVVNLSSNRIIWRVDMEDLLTSRRVVLNHSFLMQPLTIDSQTDVKQKSSPKSTSIDVIFKVEFVNYSDQTWRLEFWAKKLSTTGEPYGGFQTRLLAKRGDSAPMRKQSLYIPASRLLHRSKPISIPTAQDTTKNRPRCCEGATRFLLDDSGDESGESFDSHWHRKSQPYVGVSTATDADCNSSCVESDSSSVGFDPEAIGTNIEHSTSPGGALSCHETSNPSTRNETCGHYYAAAVHPSACNDESLLVQAERNVCEGDLSRVSSPGSGLNQSVPGSWGPDCSTGPVRLTRRGEDPVPSSRRGSLSLRNNCLMEIRRSVWVSEGVEWGWTNFVSSGETGCATCADPWQCEALYFDIKWLWMQQAVRDCLAHGECTYRVTGPSHTVQPWYHCFTCRLDGTAEDSYGCCETCAKNCHQGHKVEFQKVTVCFCDCGHNACHLWARSRKFSDRPGSTHRTPCAV